MPAIKSNVPELEARAENMKKIVLLPPEITVCELTAGGVKEKREKWCEAGKKNVEKALVDTLKEKDVRLKFMKVNRWNKKEIEDIHALYRAVGISIINHTFMYAGNMNVFPERIENFDYSIGSVEKLVKKNKADGLLIVYANDEVSTKGRKILEIVRAINPFAQREGEITSMVAALTDETGAILWFRTMVNNGKYDLRDSKSTYAFVEELMNEYPGGKK
jgi:hypothetical protein